MRRLMPVGMWAFFLALVLVAAPGVRLLGPANAYAYGNENGGICYDQEGGTGGGGGAGAGTSYGDPDGPKGGSASRNTPWGLWGGGAGFRGAGLYGQAQVGYVGRFWTIRDLIVALRIYYLRY
jgi:hypothetical protein